MKSPTTEQAQHGGITGEGGNGAIVSYIRRMSNKYLFPAPACPAKIIDMLKTMY
jgi:hypothetical protein